MACRHVSPVRYPCEASARRWKSVIQAITLGWVRSPPCTRTSISPDTPVSLWSVLMSRRAGMSCGTSLRTSDTTCVWVSAAQPSAASARLATSTFRGRSMAKSSAARPVRATQPAPRAAPSAIASPGRLQAIRCQVERASSRARGSIGGTSEAGGLRSVKRASVAMPAVAAQASPSTMPTITVTANPCTIGTGESSSTRNPAAVARPAPATIGPPRTAAACAAAPGRSRSARDSSKRAWSWIA